MISAHEARALVPNNEVDRRLLEISRLVRHAAKEGKYSLALPAGVMSLNIKDADKQAQLVFRELKLLLLQYGYNIEFDQMIERVVISWDHDGPEDLTS